jgi:hypothetical protein
MNVETLHTPQERSGLPNTGSLPPFDSAQIEAHGADLHLCAVDDCGIVHAYCSMWWRDVPPYENRRVGVIGHYASAGDEAAGSLLQSATSILREQACTVAIGPMDGNTWRRYRFVTEPGPEPPFFLEPENPPQWPLQFVQAGFKPLAHYFSAVNSDLSQVDNRVSRVAERMDHLGVQIRSAQASDLREQLTRIYRVSQIAFARNFLYTELSEAAFLAQYSKLLSQIRPELLLLAERGDELVGYIFAIPDFAQALRGDTLDTFLIKTIAILPDTGLAGLGGLLAAQVQDAGRRMGFRRCIHALMFEGNVSRSLSRRYAVTMRKYSLFIRELES